MDRQDEITSLTNELQRLTLRTNRIATRLLELDHHPTQPQLDTDTDNDAERRNRKAPLQVGDTVRITNSYQGRKNTTGIITKVLNTQVWIQPDNGDNPFRKFKANLVKVTR